MTVGFVPEYLPDSGEQQVVRDSVSIGRIVEAAIASLLPYNFGSGFRICFLKLQGRLELGVMALVTLRQRLILHHLTKEVQELARILGLGLQ